MQASAAALDFTLQVERAYDSLVGCVSVNAGPGPGKTDSGEPSLGGKLLYAAILDADARALLVAANVAGAASLAITADPATQKQAIRDGVVDFGVNSLDEALRILKNEIRKRETVAVCICGEPETIEREMRERGVQPDLRRPVDAAPVPETQALLSWRVDTAPAQWLPKLDAFALECLEENSGQGVNAAKRWLRLAPRYLGRMAQGVRLLRCEPNVARAFVERVRSAGLPVEVEISLSSGLNSSLEVIRIEPR